MKIGVLTFHRAHNYGAVLQAYAMKQALSNYGQVELIDYWPAYHRWDYALLDGRFLDKGLSLHQRMTRLRTAIKRLLLLPFRISRHRKFKSFIHTHFVSRPEARPVEHIEELPGDFDAYVYGSDQIWRVYDMVNYPCPDLAYLGAGIPAGKKKIAYAASMGRVNQDTLDSRFVRELLSEFYAIGVREKSLQHAIESFWKDKVMHVLDPTFLVSRETWHNLASASKYKINRPYLLFYSLIESPLSRQVAHKLCEELKLTLLEVNGFETLGGIFSKSTLQSAGPVDFLQLIRGADFVVSTSFHGVVFSILFQKRFYVCGMGDHVGRVSSLLNQLGLGDRLIDHIGNAHLDSTIDYAAVNVALKALVSESKQFARTALLES